MDRQAYVDKMKAQLDAWNAEIDRIEAKARIAEAEQRAAFAEHLAELRHQRDRAEEKLHEMRTLSDRAWRDMGAGFEQAFSAITDGFRRAAKRFE